MALRERLRQKIHTGYQTDNLLGGASSSSYGSLYELARDETGKGDNAPFSVDRYERSGGLLNGGSLTGTRFSYQDYPVTYMGDTWTTSHLPFADRPTNGVLATKLIAETNPSRAETVSLEYAAELSDYGNKAESEFDRRLRGLRKFISDERFKHLKKAAKLNLLYQFGIVPLISDIELLLEFQKAVDRRVKEIDRLRTRGLRRTKDLWGGSEFSYIPSATIHSNALTVHAAITKITKLNIRGHIRWYVQDNFFVSDQQVRAEAKRVILGYNLTPTTLYELMPWSWLIDYFTNLGTMVKAGDNQFPMRHDTVRIMEHLETTTTSSAHSVGGGGAVTVTPIHCKHETKTRSLATPTIGARIEFLKSSQWSILGSLAVLRGL